MPASVGRIAYGTKGLILVTGPTGSGKSTTLAAMIDLINSTRTCHIVTIEDPIEYYHPHKKSVVTQREVGVDVPDFAEALRRGLRQDPDVILVGEMRDLETIATALLAAETGHLVFSTLHTVDATETIQRIIAVFPPPEQKQIRLQMAATLKAVISQRLVRRADDKGRVPAVEVMITTGYIRDCIINPDKTRLIHDAIAAGTSQYGMQTFDQSLFDLYTRELITYEEALIRASNPDDFKLRVQGIRSASDSAREEMERTMTEFERFGNR
jgi:twitching motility protein PilT